MQITCFCVAGLPGQPETTASVNGDIITVNGTEFDLSAVPNGGNAEPQGEHPFVGKIARKGGELQFGLIWKYNPGICAPHQPEQAPMVSVVSGAVVVPLNQSSEGGEA